MQRRYWIRADRSLDSSEVNGRMVLEDWLKEREKIEEVIARVKKMEGYLDEILEFMKKHPSEVKEDRKVRDMLKELIDYYENGQWLADYECDERGELPKDLKRGVLAEDTIYNLIGELGE